jgi:hypothetical protein
LSKPDLSERVRYFRCVDQFLPMTFDISILEGKEIQDVTLSFEGLEQWENGEVYLYPWELALGNLTL